MRREANSVAARLMATGAFLAVFPERGRADGGGYPRTRHGLYDVGVFDTHQDAGGMERQRFGGAAGRTSDGAGGRQVCLTEQA
ncbi:MAG: hypothetical protein IPH75_13840 [bacterium]|nr:hypothetical protein [bacterium]